MLTIGAKQSGAAFKLAADLVTQTIAILAKRGSGKTYTASVIAEEMLGAGQQIIAVDPTGAWWGLRSKYPVVILGGEHADAPLEESAGEVIARAIVEHGFSAVLDLSLFRKGQLIRFMTAFAETLYRLNRRAVHLFVDEADAVAPQGRSYGGDENRMLGAMEDIVRRGRKRGIGCTLITQRPAVINKNVLTQCEILIALRLVHPKDIDAVMEWVNVHADPKQAKAMVESLPSLPIGEAWFWSPGWGNIFERVTVRKRETFDSGATPKAGESPKRPKHLAEIDIAALGEQIKATVEKAKADDPKELRKQLAAAKAEIIKLQAKPVAAPKVETKTVEKWALRPGEAERLEKAIEKLDGIRHDLIGGLARAAATNITGGLTRPVAHCVQKPAQIITKNITPRAAPVRREPSENGHSSGITPRQQRFLDVAATLTTLNAEVTKETIAAWSGIHPRTGSYGEDLKALVDANLIANDRGRIVVTEEGAKSAGYVDPAGAIDRAKASLSPRQAKFLDFIIERYPGPVTTAEIAEHFQIHARTGSLGDDLRALALRGLVDRDRGVFRARDILFAGTQ